MKNNIVFVIQDCRLGGGTASLSSLYNIIKSDYDITVYQLTRSGTAKVSYSEAIEIAPHFCDYYYGNLREQKGLRKFFAAIVKVLSKIYPDIIDWSTHNFAKNHKDTEIIISFGEGAAADFTSRIPLMKRITWIHYDISHYISNAKDLSLYSKFDKIVCVADKIAKRMTEMYPTLQGKVTGIHNVIDYKRVIDLAAAPIPESEQSLLGNHFTIVSVGRICKVKRFSLIPSIAADLKSKGMDFRWIIIGPETDASEVDLLKNEINRFELSDYVIAVGEKTNPYPYIKRAGLLVSTSETEACPMVFAESKILEVPVISANFLTADEFIENDVDGSVCQISDMCSVICDVISGAKEYNCKNSKDFIISYNEDILVKFKNLVNFF